MICLKANYNKGEPKVAYFQSKKACGTWLNLQQDLKSASIHFYNKRGSDVALHSKLAIDIWIQEHGK